MDTRTLPTFLTLPAELRLHIYSYLLPCTPQIRISSRKGTILLGSGIPHLSISQTCRKIHCEYISHFYRHALFTITLTPSNCFGNPPCDPLLPERHLHLHRIRAARFLISLDNIDGGNYVDLGTLLSKLPALRSLRLGFAFPRRAYMREDNAARWSKSAALQGMICHAVQSTPKHVVLEWWSDGREACMLEDWEDDFWRFVCVPRDVLEGMAGVFEMLRGCLAGSLEREILC